jgi:uncharacterized protein YjiS (DUF1127 family)
MKIREINNLNVLESHTFVPSKDDSAGLSGEFIRREPTNLPAEAEAVIYRPAKSAMTSGRACLRRWILEFTSFRRRLRHCLRSPVLRAFRQNCAAANAVVGAMRTLRSRWAERWRAWREERRRLAELARLDDRCLEDIGLRRIRTSAGGEVIVPIIDDSWNARARSAANGNARSDGTKVSIRRAA